MQISKMQISKMQSKALLTKRSPVILRTCSLKCGLGRQNRPAA
jgi:hypothetical protein